MEEWNNGMMEIARRKDGMLEGWIGLGLELCKNGTME